VTIQDIGSIGELIAAIATVATLAYLALQIRQNSALLTASQAAAFREGTTQVAVILASDREAALLFGAGCASRADLDVGDRARFDAMITIAFQHLRLGFSQAIGGWSEELESLLQSGPGVHEWWCAYSRMLPDEFRVLVNQRFETLAAAQQSAAADSA
jgi:hypothetical protein